MSTRPNGDAPETTDTAATGGSPQPTGTRRIDQVAQVLTAPVALAQRLLPANTAPVVLGAGALALVGVIDWPIAGAVGLGYLALRRWRPAKSG